MKAFIFDTNINKLISKIKPDLVVKGKEHEKSIKLQNQKRLKNMEVN